MYSQNQEEQFIVDYFKGTVGRFLDVGAFDGKTFSNSLRLVELGWNGVCIEPSPAPFAALQALHREHPNVTVVNAAVTPVDGDIDFWDTAGDAGSTTDMSHKAKWEKGGGTVFTPIKVRSMSAGTVLGLYGTRFDFVNIDTENTNLETLRAFVAAGLEFDLLCIEHDNQHPAIVAMFPGCQPIYQNAENLLIYRSV
jgi:FkbM family methyltransferase